MDFNFDIQLALARFYTSTDPHRHIVYIIYIFTVETQLFLARKRNFCGLFGLNNGKRICNEKADEKRSVELERKV